MPSQLRPSRFALLLCLTAAAFAADPFATWPEPTRENKPWTRWWWLGSAVDEASLTRELEAFAAAGLGGVEITPIYGVRGSESRDVPFLSPRWMQLLEHTGREAKRLGLGVDMATGTGWPFGGPWVQPADAAQKIVLQDGKLAGAPTKMQVKRAAPGGAGPVIDPFSAPALGRYLAPFGEAFAQFPRDLLRGQFHDSFEYYEAGWTPELAARFRTLHGYELDSYAAELLGQKPLEPEQLARLKGDYRAALASLHLDYLRAWADWSHARGWLVRNQSHGAPANLLDLYGAVDIPETEIFGSTPFPIPGLRRVIAELRNDQDVPESLIIRMASSAAHVAGRRLASSETLTWLREHWREAPSMMKPEIDRLFAEGINHLLYHGTAFSPSDAAWPGWLFYASTEFNPRNPLWRDLGELNRYVARVQSVLQSGQPDNDVLLYWPVHDVWDNPKGLAQLLTVHHVDWLTDAPVGRIAQSFIHRGVTFDYISDAQLAASTVTADQRLVTSGGARYAAIVVPATRRLPVETLRHLLTLARAGAPVVFQSLPADVPGLGRLDERRAEFQRLVTQLTGTVRVSGDDVTSALLASGKAVLPVRREPLADTGLSFLRRRSGAGSDYFLTNLTAQPVDRWVELGTPAAHAVLLDPLTGRTGTAALRPQGDRSAVYLQLAPGETLLLRTSGTTPPAVRAPAWAYLQANAATPRTLTGEWQIEFTSGGPALPAPLRTRELKSWTSFGDAEAERFAGTARYRLEFEFDPAAAREWWLDLGDVRETARVRLNGRDAGVAWAIPFRLRVGEFLQPGRNVLEIEVTNLAANRVRDLDRRGVDWKIMREINYVNILYKPFDASGWELTPSGLLGPVRLIPADVLTPQ